MHMYVPIPTLTFGTVVEPHTMYETCQSGLNSNVDDVMFYTHMYICNLKVMLKGKYICTYVHTVQLIKGNTNQ